MTELERLIPYGHENAISRRTLALALGMSDRMTRKALQAAREDGLPVLNEQDGAGYFLADDAPSIRRQIAANMARIASISRQTKHLRQRLRDMEGDSNDEG